MKVQFYVSADGEVLSNKEYPVTKRLCIIPELEGPPRPAYFEAASELELTQCRIKQRVYKAVTVTIPDDYLEPVGGIVA